ncbi:MAG: TonB-dependent receptor [Gemmatimonas sp.]
MPRLGFLNIGTALLFTASVGLPLRAVPGQTRLPTDTVRATQSATGVLIGRVLSSDGKPVPDALVVIGVVPDVRSSSTGSFFVQRMPTGVHTLEVRMFGVAPTRQKVSVARGDTVRVEIKLTRNVYQLATVRTLGTTLMKDANVGAFNDFYERMNRGQGRFFSRDDMERVVTLDQLMSTIPGVRINRNVVGDVSISFGRCNLTPGSTMFFVDGVEAMGDDLLNFYRPGDLEAMEVYRGIGELPAQVLGNACAAVFLWSRRGGKP